MEILLRIEVKIDDTYKKWLLTEFNFWQLLGRELNLSYFTIKQREIQSDRSTFTWIVTYVGFKLSEGNTGFDFHGSRPKNEYNV